MQIDTIDFTTKTKFVDALLACPAMQDRQTRNAIVSALQNVQGILRSDIDRTDVANIVDRVLDFHGSMAQLCEALRFYEGNSVHMQRVDALYDQHGKPGGTTLTPDKGKIVGVEPILLNYRLIWALINLVLVVGIMVIGWLVWEHLAYSTATPTLTPDLTQTSTAEALEIAATLTAQAPTTKPVSLSSTPTATFTPQPTQTVNFYSLSQKMFIAFMANNSSNDLLIISSEDGVDWEQNVDIGVKSNHAPSIVLFNDKLFIAFTASDSEHLLLTTSDDGEIWSKVDSVQGQVSKSQPSLEVFQDQLHVVFNDSKPPNRLKIISTLDGEDWTATIDLGWSSPTSPAIASFRDKLYVAFIEDAQSGKISLLSTSNLRAWEYVANIGVNSKLKPAIAAFNNRLYIAYIDNSNSLNIMSSVNGVNWSNSSLVTGETSLNPPSLGVFEGKLYVAFTMNGKTPYVVVASSPDGENWPNQVVIWEESSQTNVSIASE